ncbi:NUDIX hydrolase [Aquincola tertiaricarbonis]|uniref:NUDIX hydrolase n=1 Tax=Aquincola tertiaricarbonis TaxID=391953 RepID=UPI000614CF6B|nr:NUDIX hydrolase [Aquincola tertiaricarbonis]
MPYDRCQLSVTVAAVIEHEGRYLMIEEETSEGVRLNNPAGHLEPGESPLQGVIRETLEETGCSFQPQHVLGVYLSRFHRPATGEDVTYLRIAFAGTASEPAPGWVLDEGILRTVWMTPDEIRASAVPHRSPLLLRCLDDHLAGKRYPLDLLTVDPTVFAPEVKR